MKHWNAISNQVEKHYIFSFGGGVQSVAAMVLAAQGKIPYDTFVFSNVGHDSENPSTLEYIEQIVAPYMQQHKLRFEVVQRLNKAQQPVTLYEYNMNPNNRSVTIPAHLKDGGPGQRSCTSDWKVRVIDKWIKTHCTGLVYVGLGISVDEFTRMKKLKPVALRKAGPLKSTRYPLIDLRLTRDACIRIIQAEGLPIPEKSSCWFCPFHSAKAWLDLSVQQPDLFAKAVDLEEHINAKRELKGKDQLRLHTSWKPLSQVVSGDQMAMFPEEDDNCEGGYCFV